MVQTEKLRNEFSLRLSQALDAAKYPSHGRGIRLARELGVSSKAVSKWLSGEAFPRQAMIENIAALLRADVLWLQHGEIAFKGEKSALNEIFRRGYPLISWKDAENWVSQNSQNFPEYEYYCSAANLESDGAFWLKVKDDSMTSPVGLCVPINSMILVDTSTLPKSGDLVVATLPNASEATFKQFYFDGGTNLTYLRPLNTNLKPIELPEKTGIIGVVIESRMNFHSPDLANMTYRTNPDTAV